MTGSHTWVSIAQYRRSPLSHICLANPLKAITALQQSSYTRSHYHGYPQANLVCPKCTPIFSVELMVVL